MWHGDKLLPPGTPASADDVGRRVVAAVLLALALALSWWIARLAG
ncbi:MAG TPA: hypothetical protein VFQ16_10305 [Burkholderiaceae bacterium]|nr:hypothetical protein [Burkholderiaceae bacterium]